MRRLLILLLLVFSVAAHAFDRGQVIDAWTAVMKAEAQKQGNKFDWKVVDTGENFTGMVDPEGNMVKDAPVVIVQVPHKGYQCLVALHPAKPQLSGLLGCSEMEGGKVTEF